MRGSAGRGGGGGDALPTSSSSSSSPCAVVVVVVVAVVGGGREESTTIFTSSPEFLTSDTISLWLNLLTFWSLTERSLSSTFSSPHRSDGLPGMMRPKINKTSYESR